MMTYGGRRYDIPKVLHGEAAVKAATPETGMCISGKVTSDVTPKGKRNVTVTMSSNRGGLAETAVTSENGRFCFSGFEMPDSAGYMIMARSAKGNKFGVAHGRADISCSIIRFACGFGQ